MLIVLNFIIDIPVVRAVRTSSCTVIADNNISGRVEFPIKVSFRIEDYHNIFRCEIVQQLIQQLIDRVRLTSTNTSQKHNVPAEQIFIQIDDLPCAASISTQSTFHRANRIGYWFIVKQSTIKYFYFFHQFHLQPPPYY